jgi:hypothetical protein
MMAADEGATVLETKDDDSIQRPQIKRKQNLM